MHHVCVSAKREDPVSLLIRYLSTMGIRVVDLFRVFDTDSRLCVSEANFIRGLKVSLELHFSQIPICLPTNLTASKSLLLCVHFLCSKHLSHPYSHCVLEIGFMYKPLHF